MQIHGPITNRDYLVGVLNNADFIDGSTTTAFVENHPQLLATSLDSSDRHAHLVAAVLSGSLMRASADSRWSFAPIGWRNMGVRQQSVDLVDSCGDIHTCTYRWLSASSASVMSDGDERTVRVVRSLTTANGHELLLDIDGVTCTVVTADSPGQTWCNSSAGQTTWAMVDRFPTPTTGAVAGRPVAPVPGRVVAVHVVDGQTVSAGDALVTMEAMKMEHKIIAPADGTVAEVRCAVGDQVDAQQVLVVFD
jgi:propionyl-CoA carboxylase alpha chain